MKIQCFTNPFHQILNPCAWNIFRPGGTCIGSYGYGSIPINTIFSGMNIHLPAILMWTTGVPGFWPIPILDHIGSIHVAPLGVSEGIACRFGRCSMQQVVLYSTCWINRLMMMMMINTHIYTLYTYRISYIYICIHYMICIYTYMFKREREREMHIYIYISGERLWSPQCSWTRTLLGGLWNVHNFCETCATSVKHAQLLGNVHNISGTCTTSLKRAQHLWNMFLTNQISAERASSLVSDAHGAGVETLDDVASLQKKGSKSVHRDLLRKFAQKAKDGPKVYWALVDFWQPKKKNNPKGMGGYTFCLMNGFVHLQRRQEALIS